MNFLTSCFFHIDNRSSKKKILPPPCLLKDIIITQPPFHHPFFHLECIHIPCVVVYVFLHQFLIHPGYKYISPHPFRLLLLEQDYPIELRMSFMTHLHHHVIDDTIAVIGSSKFQLTSSGLERREVILFLPPMLSPSLNPCRMQKAVGR